MDLTLVEFVILALSGSCALVLTFTLISRIFTLRSETRALAKRVICRLCLHTFEDSGHPKTVHCPHCGAINEKGRSRRLG
jgi:hypothetical protein